MKKPVLLLTVGAFALAACMDNTQQMGPKTQQGAMIGGLVGAAVGTAASKDDKLKGALIGGAVGAAVGGMIGARLDQQARELQRDIGSDDVTIVNTGRELIVTMPQDILFAVDSTYVRPDLRRDLLKLADSLQRYPDTTVDVIGHTDNTGPASYNQRLSAQRAQAVADILLDAGVDPARIRAIGRGEFEPVASNLTPEGRAQNRRVEIIIRPNT